MKKLITIIIVLCAVSIQSNAWRIISYNCGTGRCHHLDKGVCKTFTPKDPSVTCEDVVSIVAPWVDNTLDMDAHVVNPPLSPVDNTMNGIVITRDFTPYPSPASEEVNIKFKSPYLDNNVNILIYSLNMSKQWKFSNLQLQSFNVSKLPSGDYYYVIMVDSDIINKGVFKVQH